jgi:type IV pilus biogenesis protein PilP
MSRLAEQARSWFRGASPCVLVLAAPFAVGQTIADYSRAQRALLENTMTQAAARSAGSGASAPVVSASMPSAPAPSSPRVPLPAAAPGVQVSGVFASPSGAVAEVVVNTTAYLLGAGQGVPGTGWRVESIAVDRVVLSRRGGVAAVGTEAEGVRRVFALPALR